MVKYGGKDLTILQGRLGMGRRKIKRRKKRIPVQWPDQEQSSFGLAPGPLDALDWSGEDEEEAEKGVGFLNGDLGVVFFAVVGFCREQRLEMVADE